MEPEIGPSCLRFWWFAGVVRLEVPYVEVRQTTVITGTVSLCCSIDVLWCCRMWVS